MVFYNLWCNFLSCFLVHLVLGRVRFDLNIFYFDFLKKYININVLFLLIFFMQISEMKINDDFYD